MRRLAMAVPSAVWLAVGLGWPAELRAERLPVKSYGSEDGLPGGGIGCIVRDARGFLWFCSTFGLAGFDGERFIAYGGEEGYSGPTVNGILPSGGGYWIATNGRGVIRWEPDAVPPAPRRFTLRVAEEPGANRVNTCYEDRAGRLWAGTDAGLFRLEGTGPQAAFQRVPLHVPDRPDRQLQVWAMLEDGEGLWIGTSWGLVRRGPDGKVTHRSVEPTRGADYVFRLHRDTDGRMWLGHDVGLFSLQGSSLTRVKGVRKRVRSLLRSREGTLWAATMGGLARLEAGVLRPYGAAEGLSAQAVISLAEDDEGNLWLGTLTGALKVVARGFTTFDGTDGLADVQITQIFEDPDGSLRVATIGHLIHRFDGRVFHAVRPNLPGRIRDAGVGRRGLLQDRAGEWWIPNGDALYRFPKVSLEGLARAVPKTYTRGDGLAGHDIDLLFEDSQGDIWIGTHLPDREVLTRWERATGRFHRYSDEHGLPSFNAVQTFGEDRLGALWIGFWGGGLARYREGRFTLLAEADGVPPGAIYGFSSDAYGRLWFGTEEGPARIDDPGADRPRVVRYTDVGSHTRAVVADAFGRIYFATARGVDRLDPASGQLKHYTKADGVLAGVTRTAFRGRDGSLWFGGAVGLSRLVPVPDAVPRPPPVWIGGLEVAGERWPLADLGQGEVSGLRVGPDRNHVRIDFFGLAPGLGASLRYRYKLEGAERDWNAATRERSVTYARLSPGRYRFVVEALGEDDRVSTAPATVAFVVLAPVWQRPWFLAGLAFLAGSAGYGFYRHRLGMLLHVERVRTRIASDLHDDIGSGLSRIAILSELVRQTWAKGDGRASRERVAHVAEISRELVDSMSDIVWAINPRRDSLAELSQRMRHVASELFTALGVSFRYQAPGAGEETRLGADLRRHVLLIFKEGVNNIAKHSGCTEAAIDLEVRDDVLLLRLADNGKGLTAGARSDGHGLASMAARARALGGELQVLSEDGRGTTLTLRVPLEGRLRGAPASKTA